MSTPTSPDDGSYCEASSRSPSPSRSASPLVGICANMTFAEISKYFDMKLEDACRIIGLSTTSMKKLCRQYHIQRWPFRKIHSLNNKKKKIEGTLTSSSNMSIHVRLRLTEQLQRVDREISKIKSFATYQKAAIKRRSLLPEVVGAQDNSDMKDDDDEEDEDEEEMDETPAAPITPQKQVQHQKHLHHNHHGSPQNYKQQQQQQAYPLSHMQLVSPAFQQQLRIVEDEMLKVKAQTLIKSLDVMNANDGSRQVVENNVENNVNNASTTPAVAANPTPANNNSILPSFQSLVQSIGFDLVQQPPLFSQGGHMNMVSQRYSQKTLSNPVSQQNLRYSPYPNPAKFVGSF